MRRVIALLALLLLVASTAAGQAGKPAIRDATALLSDQTLREAAEVIAIVKADTGIQLLVELRHFLGGADAPSKARELLTEEEDSEHSLLLLAAVGEESYALAAGKAAQALLSKEAQDNLLSASFRQPFLNRSYDEAMAGFLRQAGERLAKASGKPSSLGVLTTHAPATQQPRNDQVFSFPITIGREARPTASTADALRTQQREKDKGMSFFSVVAISFVLYSIFGKKKRKGEGGCGCGPLGWILGGLGLSRLFGWRR